MTPATTEPVRSAFRVPGMDCPTEEQLVRGRLAHDEHVRWLHVDLAERTVVVAHDPGCDEVVPALAGLGLGAQHLSGEEATAVLADAPVDGDPERSGRERTVLRASIALNVVGLVAGVGLGLRYGSTAVLADGIDMGADVVVYVPALLAVGATAARQRLAARGMGVAMALLAAAGLVEVARRVATGAPPPDAAGMALAALLGLAINLAVMRLVTRVRDGGAHMRSTWIMTSTDVQANLVTVVAAGLVALTGLAVPDLVVGAMVFAVVGRGAVRMLRTTG